MNLIMQDFNEPVSTNNYELSITNYELRNFPNPFNPSTTIYFIANDAKNAKLEIYNIKGQKIKTFPINTSTLTPINTIVWDGKDDNNNPVSSGVYLYRIKSDDYFSEAKKMLMIK